MRAVWAVLLLATSLAGCADGGDAEPEPEAFQQAKATADTGLIRGVVVDGTITPVEGVTVSLNPGGSETVTDAEGAFVFTDLDPGAYFLQTRSKAYTDVQTSTEVEAGVERPPIVRIQVQAIQLPDPFVQAIVWEAFMDTSTHTAGVSFVAGGFTGQGTFGAQHELPRNASWVQSELVWTPEQPLADTMQIFAGINAATSEQAGDDYVAGVSPLLQFFDDTEVTKDTTEVGFTLFVGPSSLGVPVGATLQQRLTMFTHSFHYFVPDDGWRFSEDGDHRVPEG